MASEAGEQLASIVIGPRTAGRSYGVRHISNRALVGRRADNRLADFSLALAAWSERSEPGFVCLFALDADLWVLLRAAHLGQADLGTVAVAHGWLLSGPDLPDLIRQAPRFLEHLPEPTSPDALLEPLPLALVDTRSPGSAAATIEDLAETLTAYDLKLLVSGHSVVSAVAAIATAYAGDDPIGWSTSATLEANGTFDPAATFNLVATDTPAPGFVPDLVLQDGKLDAVLPPAPEARRVWLALTEAGLPIRWSRADASLDARAFTAASLSREIEGRAPNEVLPRIAHLLTAPQEAVFGDGVRAGTLEAFETWFRGRGSRPAEFDALIESLEGALRPPERARLAQLALSPGLTVGLAGGTLDRLGEAIDAGTGGLSADDLADLLNACADRLMVRPVASATGPLLTRMSALLRQAGAVHATAPLPRLAGAVARAASAIADLGDTVGLTALASPELRDLAALRPDGIGRRTRQAIIDRLWRGGLNPGLKRADAISVIGLSLQAAEEQRRRKRK